jgi:hypothetical protein
MKLIAIMPASPYPRKSMTGALASKSNAACFFFYHRGVVHHEFTPEGQRVNQDFYLVVLRHLWDAVQRKRPDMCTTGSWLLHHNNALLTQHCQLDNSRHDIQFLPFYNPPIHLISPLLTFFYSISPNYP